MQNSNKKSKECCDKCKDAPKCKPNCCLRHFHCANCPCHKPSNKKSKCCKECNAYKNIDGTDKFYWECNNPSCPCHKPSVEVILHKFDSGCLSGCKLDHSKNTCDHYDSDCNRCGKLEREHNPLPQSIPLDRDEGEDKCCCYLYDCELGCRERQCCCIPEYTHKVKDHTPLKYRDFFEIKFPTLPTQRTIRKGRSYQCQRRDIY